MSAPTELPAIGSRWLRTSSGVRGLGLHVFVTACEPAQIGERAFVLVRYRHEGSARTGSMPAREFLRVSAHVPADASTDPKRDPVVAALVTLHGTLSAEQRIAFGVAIGALE